MENESNATYTAFEGTAIVARGNRAEVGDALVGRWGYLIFDDETGEQVELDERITEVARRPGRPKLGVVAREVTLLPRHWEWLNGQPGGASVALRKLVEEARRNSSARDRARLARDAAYRFLTSLCGNMPGYEEVLRALYAGEEEAFTQRLGDWPRDMRDYAIALAKPSFVAETEQNRAEN